MALEKSSQIIEILLAPGMKSDARFVRCAVCNKDFNSKHGHTPCFASCPDIFGYECIIACRAKTGRSLKCPVCGKVFKKSTLKIIFEDRIPLVSHGGAGLVDSRRAMQQDIKELRVNEDRLRMEATRLEARSLLVLRNSYCGATDPIHHALKSLQLEKIYPHKERINFTRVVYSEARRRYYMSHSKNNWVGFIEFDDHVEHHDFVRIAPRVKNIHSVAIDVNSSGNLLALAYETSIFVFDLEHRKLKRTVVTENTINSVAFSALKESDINFGSIDGRWLYYDSVQDSVLWLFDFKQRVVVAGSCGNGRVIFLTKNRVLVGETATGQEMSICLEFNRRTDACELTQLVRNTALMLGDVDYQDFSFKNKFSSPISPSVCKIFNNRVFIVKSMTSVAYMVASDTMAHRLIREFVTRDGIMDFIFNGHEMVIVTQSNIYLYR